MQGGSIFSTFPIGSGGWATLSGTSMATPYVRVDCPLGLFSAAKFYFSNANQISGVAALFFASRGGRAALGDGGAKLAHEVIVASGNPIRHYDGTDNLAYVYYRPFSHILWS